MGRRLSAISWGDGKSVTLETKSNARKARISRACEVQVVNRRKRSECVAVRSLPGQRWSGELGDGPENKSLPVFEHWQDQLALCLSSPRTSLIGNPMSAEDQLRTHAPQKMPRRYSTTSWTLGSYSGNPALRKPSIITFALIDSWLRAIYADIVKAGSISSIRAAASRASASRPRWAKADARQRYGPG